eukprot:9040317-Alexandrium_andersonii.AAC.1
MQEKLMAGFTQAGWLGGPERRASSSRPARRWAASTPTRLGHSAAAFASHRNANYTSVAGQANRAEVSQALREVQVLPGSTG